LPVSAVVQIFFAGMNFFSIIIAGFGLILKQKSALQIFFKNSFMIFQRKRTSLNRPRMD